MRSIKNTSKNKAKLLAAGYTETSGSCAYVTDFLTVLDAERIFYKDSVNTTPTTDTPTPVNSQNYYQPGMAGDGNGG